MHPHRQCDERMPISVAAGEEQLRRQSREHSGAGEQRQHLQSAEKGCLGPQRASTSLDQPLIILFSMRGSDHDLGMRLAGETRLLCSAFKRGATTICLMDRAYHVLGWNALSYRTPGALRALQAQCCSTSATVPHQHWLPQSAAILLMHGDAHIQDPNTRYGSVMSLCWVRYTGAHAASCEHGWRACALHCMCLGHAGGTSAHWAPDGPFKRHMHLLCDCGHEHSAAAHGCSWGPAGRLLDPPQRAPKRGFRAPASKSLGPPSQSSRPGFPDE